MSLPAIVAQAQAAAVGADAAPGGAGMAAAVLLPAKGEQRAGDRPPVDVDRVPHRPDVAAVAQPPHHIDDIEAHRRGADIPAPGVILPADRHAGPAVGLIFTAAGTGDLPAGAPAGRVAPVAVGGKAAGIHIDQVGAEEHPAIRQRSIHLQHGGMRLQVGIAAGAAGTPEVMFQGDVQILLTIKVGGIAADPALQPVIMAVVARQPRKSIVILRLRGGNAGGHHRFPVVRQRLLRRPALGGKARGIAQHQRALHRGRLRLRLRHNLIKNPLRVSGIAKASSRQRHPPLHVHGFGLCAFQLHDLRPGGRFIALGQVDFRKAEARIAVVGLLTQHPLIVGNRRLAVSALLRPVGQRQVIAH